MINSSKCNLRSPSPQITYGDREQDAPSLMVARHTGKPARQALAQSEQLWSFAMLSVCVRRATERECGPGVLLCSHVTQWAARDLDLPTRNFC